MFKLTIKNKTAKQRRRRKKTHTKKQMFHIKSAACAIAAEALRGKTWKASNEAQTGCTVLMQTIYSLLSCNKHSWGKQGLCLRTPCLHPGNCPALSSAQVELQHEWPALSAGFPHHQENPLTCCTRVRDGWNWVSQCFLQSFLPCAIEKSNLHTMQCTNCGPFAEERSAGYKVLYSWWKFWWYVFFFGLFFAVGSSSVSWSWRFRFSAISVFPP